MIHTILKFTCETWIYMLSISLQVSGAICLIMNYWGNVKEKVIITYYAGGEMAKAQDNDMILLKKERLQSCAKDIYANRFSFIYIILGYAIGLFGNIADTDNKLYMLLLIFIFCVILTCIGCYLPSLISKKVYAEDMEVERKIIEKVTDVQWSDKEQIEYIDSLFDDSNN